MNICVKDQKAPKLISPKKTLSGEFTLPIPYVLPKRYSALEFVGRIDVPQRAKTCILSAKWRTIQMVDRAAPFLLSKTVWTRDKMQVLSILDD